MLKLIKAERIHEGMVRLDYEVSHSTPGLEGTTLKADLSLNITDNRATAHLNIGDIDAPTPKEAIERTIRWLERLKEGLEKRKDTWLPL